MASIYRKLLLDEIEVSDWDAQMAVDLRAAWLCVRAAVPHMRRVRGGRIVNFSDWVARSGRPRYVGYLTYYVAKAGIVALTEALALELAPDQILVNAVAPRAHCRTRGDLGRGVCAGGARDAAGPLGWRDGNRQSRARTR